jgi:hypothetical protein
MKRIGFLVVTCGALGMAISVQASNAAGDRCLQMSQPTADCLNAGLSAESETDRKVNAMVQGLILGVGAALGASWNVLKDELSAK